MDTQKSIENVLTETINVTKFDEIEGFSDALYMAVVKLIRYVSKANDEKNITENCRVAFAMLSIKDRCVLQEHLGNKNIAHIMLALKNVSRTDNDGGLFKHFFGGGGL